MRIKYSIVVLLFIFLMSCHKPSGLMIVIKGGKIEISRILYELYYMSLDEEGYKKADEGEILATELPYKLFVRVSKDKLPINLILRVKGCMGEEEVVDQEFYYEKYRGGYKEVEVRVGGYVDRGSCQEFCV